MKTDIQKMLAEAYEIEGLLLLADNRGDDTPEYVFTAIGEKLGRMQELLNMPAENDAETAPAGKEPAHVSEETASENVEEQDEPEEIAEVAAEMIDEDETDTTEPEQIVEVVTEEEPLPDEPEIEDVPEEEEEEELEDTDYEEPLSGQADDDVQKIRLDEKLQRTRSKDLKSAFSLNDTFRFRRELFGNSGAVMTDALHLVEAMKTYDEAEDYFYGDLGWDRESDDVKEFMAIIKNHFL